MKIIAMLLLGVALLSFSAYRYIEMTKPSSFEECVLHNMKGQSDKLLQVAGKLCRRKFPNKDKN